jgi:hypothetical protein
MMHAKFVLRKSVVVLAIAFALTGPALPTNAFAVGGVLEGGRIVTDANAQPSDRVRQGHERRYEWKPQGHSGYEWDPWIHWGGYYGPPGII